MQHCFAYKNLSSIKTILTIHNAQYQGWIDWSKSNYIPDWDKWKWGLLEWDNTINSLASAIKCAAKVNTVSHGYLEELMYSANGLEKLFQYERGKCFGIYAALIETIETLLEDGAPVDRIIATTGRKVGALEARMRRAGRLDLSRQLGNIRNAMRRKGCPHCGKSIWSGATQCGTCANKASSAKKREAKVAVLEMMLEADPFLNVEHAAARLGYSSGNGVQQMLRRAERDDLLDVFARNSARAGARVTSKRRERAA